MLISPFSKALDLSIIIVNWNTCQLLANCLRSVLGSKSQACQFEVIVVDNASTDGSPEMVAQEFPQVQLIKNDANLGFTRANNQGIRCSQGRYVLLLNSDTVVPDGTLARMVQFMDTHPEAGVMGPRSVLPDGTPQPYAFGDDPTLLYLLRRGLSQALFKRYLHDWRTDAIQVVDWVSGACLLARRAAINQVGLLDEHIFMYFEDNDWCLRMRQAGWTVYFNPKIEIVHLGGQSLAQNEEAQQSYYRSLRYFHAKHYGRLDALLLGMLLPIYRMLVRR